MDHRGLRLVKNAYFLLLTHTNQLLFLTFCDTTIEIEACFWTNGKVDGKADGQRDLEIKMVI